MRKRLLDRYGIRVVVIGRKDLLPPDVQDSVFKVEEMTANNRRGCLNVAFPYSAQEEMATAIYKTVQDSITGKIPTSSIDVDTIDNKLYTSHSPPLDILVRTSGVCRLSDFLLWQSSLNSTEYQSIEEASPENLNLLNPRSSESNDDDDLAKLSDSRIRNTKKGPSIHFVPKFWPDFGLLDVLPIILGWQAEEIFNRFVHFI